MSPNDVELVRLGRTGMQMRLGLVLVALLLAVAVVKPWPGPSPAATQAPAPSAGTVVAVLQASATPTAADSANQAGSLCDSPDGWRIVADDVEFGRPIRSWLVAPVEYSTVPPVRSAVPVTVVVSKGVDSLGFCLPVGESVPSNDGWSGTLWRVGSSAADSSLWQAVAQIVPMPGSRGALADPVDASAKVWPVGHYVLEARFVGSDTEAWLGLVIEQAP